MYNNLRLPSENTCHELCSQEIHGFDSETLKKFYVSSLTKIIEKDDLTNFTVDFKKPSNDFYPVRYLTVKPNGVEWNLFGCTLQTFPGCCGYLIMSGMLARPETLTLAEPFIRGVFDLAWFLNYQQVFTTHTASSNWGKFLCPLFDKVTKTGNNKRTGNELILLSKEVQKPVVQKKKYKIPAENPPVEETVPIRQRIRLRRS